ncbi:hypothetical protein Z043_125412, partial [Scleropages formosus]
SSLTGEYFVFTKYTYDALGQRLRLREFGYQHNKSFHVDLLMLFRQHKKTTILLLSLYTQSPTNHETVLNFQGILYNISYHDHTCKKRGLNATFHPIEVPRDATLMSQVILGSSSGPGQGLLVNTWTGKVPGRDGMYYATFTEFGCFPVSNFYHSNKTGWVIV